MASAIWPPAGSGGAAGVSSLNTLTGDLTLAAGTGITITPSGSTLTIASTGGGGSPGGTSGQVQYNNAGAFGGFGSWNGTTLAITGAISSTTTVAVGTNLHVFGTSIMAGDMVVQGGANFSGNLGFYGASEIAQPTGNVLTALSNLGLVASPTLALSNLPTQANNTILGNNSGGTAVPSALTVAQVNAILPVFTSTLNGLAPLSGGGTANFLRADGSWTAPAGTAGITALTGDGTATGPGSVALTLATVNANVGSFGSSTSIPSLTVNAKGLVTAASGNVVIAPAGTLSGTTLNSTVVSSSLTSVGTITSGTWNGTTIAIANGGTGQTTANPAFNALSPLTTKGDVLGFSTVNARLAVGANGTALVADSTQTTGLKWQAPINARYFASSTTITSSLATITYTTKDYDSNNAYSAGTYTVPVAGKYQINANLGIAATYAAGNAVVIAILKNGSIVSQYQRNASVTEGSIPIFLADIINCAASDTITIQASSVGTSPSVVVSNTRNYFSIAYLSA